MCMVYNPSLEAIDSFEIDMQGFNLTQGDNGFLFEYFDFEMNLYLPVLNNRLLCQNEQNIGQKCKISFDVKVEGRSIKTLRATKSPTPNPIYSKTLLF